MLKLRVVVCALLGVLGGCSEVPPTQMLVRVEASATVAAKLKYIRAFLYPANATDERKWTEDAQFVRASLPIEGHPDTVLLGSFGVAKGPADRFKIVVKGYESSDASAEPVIEQKGLTSFQKDMKFVIRLSLLDVCYRPATSCEGLAQTCAPANHGACGPVPELMTSIDDDDVAGSGTSVGAGQDASTVSPPRDSGIPDANAGAPADSGSAASSGFTCEVTKCPALPMLFPGTKTAPVTPCCYTEGGWDACSGRIGVGACNRPAVNDSRCDTIEISTIRVAGCCATNGQCGVNSNSSGQGCLDLDTFSETVRQLLPTFSVLSSARRACTPSHATDAGT